MTYRVLSMFVVITIMGCGNSQENATLDIDQRSYNLGGIGAFGKW